MIEHVQKVLDDIKRVVPSYDAAQGYELAGFVWFQGWNAMVDSGTSLELLNTMLKGMEQTQDPLLPKFRTALGSTSASVADPAMPPPPVSKAP